MSAYRPVKTLTGEQPQADWGHFGYINMDGKRKKPVCFLFRTKLFTCSVRCCLQNAFAYIGRVSQIILFDNEKAVVFERMGSLIQFNRDLTHARIS